MTLQGNAREALTDYIHFRLIFDEADEAQAKKEARERGNAASTTDNDTDPLTRLLEKYSRL